MKPFLLLILLFAMTTSYSQNNILITDIVRTNQNLNSENLQTQDSKEIKYTYFGLTMNAPDPNKIYAIDEIEKKPEFPGNEVALKAFIKENFKTPIASSGEKVAGTIFASFVIEKDGSISEIGVLHDYGHGSGDEAIRVLSQMPKWIAGKNDSSAVRCMYAMPIICDGE